MKRPSSSFLVCVAVAIVFGGIGFWFLSKLRAFPMQQWRSLTFSEILRGQPGYTPEQKAANRKRVEELKRKMLTEFPSLVIHEKPVPDERNGFRQLYDLTEEMDQTESLVTPALREQLDRSSPWDPEAMRAALAENAELIARIESIAALPDRSSANMPKSYSGYYPSEQLKACVDILLAKARLAAEAKDETEALRMVTATRTLISHQMLVEAPTFFGSVSASLIDLQVQDATFEKLLPALGRDADFPKWRAVFSLRPDQATDDFARMLRGEWNLTMNLFLSAAIVEWDTKGSPQKTDAGIRALASQYAYWIHQLPGKGPSVLLSLPTPPSPGSRFPSELREIIDSTRVGSEGMAKGYARIACLRVMTLAALDLLILEKSGTTLTTDSASQVAPEPLTGDAFFYDPITRILTMNPTFPSDMAVKSLVLPW